MGEAALVCHAIFRTSSEMSSISSVTPARQVIVRPAEYKAGNIIYRYDPEKKKPSSTYA
jgi:hypothetical protein